MVTKTQAVAATHGAEFHYTGKHDCARIIGARGGVTIRVTRVRPSGKCKTWITRPYAFKLPVKFGLYESAYITNDDAGNWHTAEDCPLALWQDRDAFVAAVASVFADTPHVLVRAPREDEPRTAWTIVVAPAPIGLDDPSQFLARLATLAHVTRTRDTFDDDGRVFNRFCVAPRAGVRLEAFHA
jgi:hypothetical protein